VSQSGTRLLGSPIGSEEFSRQLLSEAIQKIETITSKLVLLEDPMSQYVLLRSTLGLSKFGYILRTTPCSDFPDLLDRFDSIMLEALGDLMGSALSPAAASQTALPVSMGGMGLRRSRDHSAGALCRRHPEVPGSQDRPLPAAQAHGVPARPPGPGPPRRPLQAESSRVSQCRTQQTDWKLSPARAVRGGDAVRAGRAHLQRGHRGGAALQVLQQALRYLWTPCLLLFGPRRRGNWET